MQQATINRIRQWMRATGKRPATVAHEAGLSKGTLRSVFDDTWNPTSSTIFAIEALIPADFQPQPEPAEEAA